MTVPVGTVVGSSIADAGNDVGAQDELLLDPAPPATPVAVDAADEADALEVMFGMVMLPEAIGIMLEGLKAEPDRLEAIDCMLDAPEADADGAAVADDPDAVLPESTVDVAEAT